MVGNYIEALPCEMGLGAEDEEPLSPSYAQSEHFVLTGADSACKDEGSVQKLRIGAQGEFRLPPLSPFLGEMGLHAAEIIGNQKTGLFKIELVSISGGGIGLLRSGGNGEQDG